MTDISAAGSGSIYDQLGLSETPSQRNDQLGREDFLRLLTTQMRYQDPTQPMNPDQMLTQLAQFSSVQGLEDLNRNFQSLAVSLVSSQALQATQLVGKQALVPAETLNFAEEPVAGAVELPFDSSNVTIRIENEQGELVDTLQLDAQSAGLVHFQWDGLDENGDPYPPGKYRIRATAVGASGTQGLDSYALARIDSVDFGTIGQPMTVQLRGLGSFTFDQIRQIA